MQVHPSPEFLASQDLTPTLPSRFWAKVDKNGPLPDPEKYPDLKEPCWVWTAALDGHGYGIIKKNGIQNKKIRGHVASWLIHFGAKSNSLCVLHRCDFPTCVNPAHLFLGTRKDNLADCSSKGRKIGIKGEQSNWSKLTNKQVLKIRKLYVRGKYGYKKLGKQFGVCPRTITFIVNGQHWTHI